VARQFFVPLDSGVHFKKGEATMLVEQSLFETSKREFRRESWHYDTAAEIMAALTDTGNFPCPFSQIAVKNRNLVFAFVEDESPVSLLQSASDLRSYLHDAKIWDGNLNSAKPLIMAFNPQNFHAESVEGYHAMGWKMLQYWHDIDKTPWPSNVSRDPQSPFWSMCFDGVQIFVNISNPSHHLRKSRNLGSAMTFVINPRERFDRIAGDHPQGRKVRAHVRERIERFDLIPHSPDLGSYQVGDLEWVQYGLTEDNEPRKDQCPFHHRDPAGERSRLGDDQRDPTVSNVEIVHVERKTA
jgi:FPC/CPF motif-containing protein YcgG